MFTLTTFVCRNAHSFQHHLHGFSIPQIKFKSLLLENRESFLCSFYFSGALQNFRIKLEKFFFDIKCTNGISFFVKIKLCYNVNIFLKGVRKMSNVRIDWKLLLGIVIAHLLLYYTFDHTKVFWYLFTGSMFILIAYSIWIEDVDDELPLGQYLLYGIVSGVILYLLFWFADFLFDTIEIQYLINQVESLYRKFAPDKIWHHIVLILIIIPGEEFFWRGFVLKRLLKRTTMWTSIILSTLLYASVQLYSGALLLVLAALASGLVWGYLYAKKRSLPLVIISHLIFDLLLLVLFPLI